MVKINSDVRCVLEGQRVFISKYNLAKESMFIDSPIRNSLAFCIGKQQFKACEECGRRGIDSCWNCNKSICENCAYFVLFIGVGLIFNVCKSCRDEILKLGRIGVLNE